MTTTQTESILALLQGDPWEVKHSPVDLFLSLLEES